MLSLGMLLAASPFCFFLGFYLGITSPQKKMECLSAFVLIFTFPLSLISVFAFTSPIWGRSDSGGLGLLILPVFVLGPVALFAIVHVGWVFGKVMKLSDS